MYKFWRNSVACVMAVAMAIGILCTGMQADAKEGYKVDESQTNVKVGWFDSEFYHKDANGYRSGYAYEYQQKIASYANFQYEYISGDWYDLLDDLKAGEIDVLADVSYDETRAQEMLFSALPMGQEKYVLLVNADNKEIDADDVSTLNGKKIGVAEGDLVRNLYNAWAEKNGITSEVVTLTETQEEQAEMLEAGTVDAIVDYSGFESFFESSVPLFTIGTSDFYFAINKDKPELKTKIDSAMNMIFAQNRNYNENLDDKYISKTAVSRYLSADEIYWLQRHGTIRIGYKDDYYPYSATENDQVAGLLNDLIHKMSTNIKNANINIEAVPYQTTEAAIKAVHEGEIDLVFPIMYEDYYAETNNLLLTNTIAESKIDAVIRNDSVDSFDPSENISVAMVKGDTSHESIVRASYPDWNIKTYKTLNECLYAVANHHADCFVVCDYRVKLLNRQMEKYGLVATRMNTTATITFATRDTDVVLCSIANKMIGTLDSSNITAALAQYSAQNRKVGLTDFFRDNTGLVLSIFAFILILTAILLAIILRVNRRLRRQNRKIDEQNDELRIYHEQLQSSLEEEKSASEHDALTGLYNRRMYKSMVRRVEEGIHSIVCVVNMDVNGLKYVNDNLGHQEGDALITAAAQAIKDVFGEMGTIYRTGGDEFAAIILDQEIDKQELYNRLQTRTRMWKGNFDEELTISVGIAVSEANVPTAINDLIEEADTAMYADKRLFYSKKGNDRRQKDENITKSQLAGKIADLKTMFETVRMIDLSEHRAIRYDEKGEEYYDDLHCFNIWGKTHACTNCISAKASKDHGRHSKFEISGDDIYFINSQYFNVDGKPVLLEVVHKLEDTGEVSMNYQDQTFGFDLKHCKMDD